jgi:hypothetical protein
MKLVFEICLKLHAAVYEDRPEEAAGKEPDNQIEGKNSFSLQKQGRGDILKRYIKI